MIANADYRTMPIAGLNECLMAAEAAFTAAKADLAAIQAAIGERFTPVVKQAYESASKSGGALTVDLGEGFKARADIGKKVSWDQPRLQALAGSLTWAEVLHYFKITFNCPEAIYNAAPPGPIKDALTAARTVEYGAQPKLVLQAPGSK